MRKKRVVVAMSGGVDSSVAAALLKKSGYDVTGVTMRLIPPGEDTLNEQLILKAIADAKKVSLKLGIQHQVFDCCREFEEKVIVDFYQEYSRGRTPNPCIRCNEYVKFGALLERAEELGADFLATGHHARAKALPDGYYLRQGIDQAKDQSYFLYTLSQHQLKHLLFPIGNFHKADVRRMATEFDLPVASTRESQDICFIPDHDYRTFIANNVATQPGDITDTGGNVLGTHQGLIHYTVGQRQGLSLSSHNRLYVIKLDAPANRLIVGNEDDLYRNTLVAGNIRWVSGDPPYDSNNISAKIRYRSPETKASLHIDHDRVRVDFRQAQRAITPGQAVVFYQEDFVLGGGIIEN